jgi:iron-sulfur cluster assembly accessory protein
MEGGAMDSVQQATDFNITFTKAALGEMKKFAEAENANYFRISVLPGGCSGFKYDFNLVDNPEEDDIVIEQENGLKVIVDPFSTSYLNGTLVHYVMSMQASGFTFNNPNSTAKCGCGSSFAA